MALSYLYVLCMWMHLVNPSLGTGFVYHFPGVTMQRQHIKSEKSGSTGPPGAGSRTQLRCALTGEIIAINAQMCILFYNGVELTYNIQYAVASLHRHRL